MSWGNKYPKQKFVYAAVKKALGRKCRNCGKSVPYLNKSRFYCDEKCKREFYEKRKGVDLIGN